LDLVRVRAADPSFRRRAESRKSIPKDVDMVIFRENTEDVYAGYELEARHRRVQKAHHVLKKEFGWDIREDSGIGIKPISITGTKRLVRAALQYAVQHKGASPSRWCTRATS
jgi:isocitrate dehydrogenase